MVENIEYNMLRRVALGDIIRRNATRHPGRPALVQAAAGRPRRSWSWAEFNMATNRVANGLRELGVGKGDKVGVLSLNSPEFVVLIFAVMKVGAVIAPVSAALRNDDLVYVIGHSDARIVFVQEPLLDVVAPVARALPQLRFGHIALSGARPVPQGWVDFQALLDHPDATEPEVEIDIDDVASLTFTSGTEAHPKGVMLTHGNLYHLKNTMFDWGIRPSDIALQVLPLFYTGGLGVMAGPLLMGQTLVLPESAEPPAVVQVMREQQASFIVLPPTLWIRLLREVESLPDASLPLRIGVTFGATLSETMIKGWNRIHPQLQWVSFYGQSETACCGSVGLFRDYSEIPEGDLGWVGKPTDVLEIRIVDDADQEVPCGAIGEILFRGPAVFKGYYKDEARTQTAFRGGWLHSGDLGRINADGELFFVDRLKDMVKSGGENIASASVEYAVSAHPKVAEVAAFGIPDPEWMEALCLALTPAQGQSLTEEEILAFCRQTLPRFKQPKHVFIVEDFPRTASGKILKRELRQRYAAAREAGQD